jgi:hypothetical protein
MARFSAIGNINEQLLDPYRTLCATPRPLPTGLNHGTNASCWKQARTGDVVGLVASHLVILRENHPRRVHWLDIASERLRMQTKQYRREDSGRDSQGAVLKNEDPMRRVVLGHVDHRHAYRVSLPIPKQEDVLRSPRGRTH